MTSALHGHLFDTVLGRIGFDENGDVTQQSTVLYIWHADGSRMLEQGVARQ